MKFPMICLFSHDGRPELEVTEFLQQVMCSHHEGWKSVRYRSYCGISMLPYARNLAVSDFLSMKDCTDLIFVDQDNSAEPDSLVTLLNHNVDVIGAPIRKKLDGEPKWNVNWLLDRPIKIENGMIEVETVGTGLLCMSRRCLEAMRDRVQFDWYHDRFAISGRAWPLFQYFVRDHIWLGEDVKFCLDWRKMGERVYIDPSIRTNHIGRTSYSGSLKEFLEINPPTISITPSAVSINNEISKFYADSQPVHSQPGETEPPPSVLIDNNEKLPPAEYQNGGGAGLR